MGDPTVEVEQVTVERMLDAQVCFADIESYIDDIAGITEDDRDALWLLAWSQTPRRRRQAEVRQSPGVM